MPRKGAKLFTKRDERNKERKAESINRLQKEIKEETRERALKEYNLKSNPNIPSTKTERRALKAALAAEGISMCVWNSGEDVSRFGNIAKERFVNRKNTINITEEVGDFESDPWLQMFFHIPADAYPTSVGEVKATSSKKEQHKKKKEKQSHAKPKKEADDLFDSCYESVGATAVAVSTHSAEPLTPTLTHAPVLISKISAECSDSEAGISHVNVPKGKVVILNKRGFPLTAEPSGRLMWNRTKVRDWEHWTLHAARDGKYTLCSFHGKYLSHCLLWGFIANREKADDWEMFHIELNDARQGEGGECSDNEVMFGVKSWQGANLSDGTSQVFMIKAVD